MKTIRFLQIAMLSAIIAFVSCSKEELGSSSGKEVRVALSTQLPALIDKTRSVTEEVADIPGFHLRYILEVWTTGSNPKLFDRQIISAASKRGNFTLKFLSGQTYDILLWADYVHDGQDGEGKDLNEDMHYLTPDLKTVTKNGALINSLQFDKTAYNTRDAFYAYKQVAATTDIQENITLNRAVAQLNIFTTDLDGVPAGYEPDNSLITIKAPSNFDVSTGIASSQVVDYVQATSIKQEKEGTSPDKNKTFTGYYFASDTKADLVTFTAIFRQGEKAIINYDLSNIPLQRNYRTNINGALLTKNGTIEVETEAAFSNTDNDVNVTNISAKTPGELQNKILAEINAGTFNTRQQAYIKQTDAVTANAVIDLTLKDGNAEVTDNDLPRLLSFEFVKDVTGGTTTIKLPEAYTGTVNVKTQSGESNVLVDASGASVYTDGTYGILTVSSGGNTCNIASTAKITTLNVEKGNLIVPKDATIGTININAGAGDYAEYASIAANVTINVNKTGGHNLRLIGGSSTTAVNVTEGGSNVEILSSATVKSVSNTGGATSTVTIFEGSGGTQTLTGYDDAGQVIRFVGYTDNVANSAFLMKNVGETGTEANNGANGLYQFASSSFILDNLYNLYDGLGNTFTMANDQRASSSGFNAFQSVYRYNKQVNDQSDVVYYMPSAAEGLIIGAVYAKDASFGFGSKFVWCNTEFQMNTSASYSLNMHTIVPDLGVVQFSGGIKTSKYEVRAVAVNKKAGALTYPYVSTDSKDNPVIIFRSNDNRAGIKAAYLNANVSVPVPGEVSTYHAMSNNKLPFSLRVAKKYCSADGTPSDEPKAMDWLTAMSYVEDSYNEADQSFLSKPAGSETGCAAYYEEQDSSDKGKWRLPNASEMSVIGLLGGSTVTSTYPKLFGTSSSLSAINGYSVLPYGSWCLSSTFREKDYCINVSGTGIHAAVKQLFTEKSRYVRCVRDVE